MDLILIMAYSLAYSLFKKKKYKMDLKIDITSFI